MSKFKVVTTFHNKGYNDYAKKMIESFSTYWDSSIKLHAYYEMLQEPGVQSNNITYLDYNVVCGAWQDAFSRVSLPKEEEVYKKNKNNKKFKKFLFEANRFSHKFFACRHAIENTDSRYVIWCDADVVTLHDVAEIWLDKFIQSGKYWSRIGRGPTYHPECGFMIWDTHSSYHEEYWNFMDRMYFDFEIFDQKEWHDSYIWWQAEKHTEKKFKESIHVEIGTGKLGHGFVKGPLGEKMDHLKGDRKETGFSKERTYK